MNVDPEAVRQLKGLFEGAARLQAKADREGWGRPQPVPEEGDGHMTGPEHYRAAEQLIAEAENTNPVEAALVKLRKAELHLEAAQVAATVDTANRRLPQDWYDAIGRKGESDG